MIKTLAILFGVAFLLGGALGFVPGVTKDGMYFGVFMVNAPHNFLHIASGSIFLIASMAGPSPARLWFQIFGSFYAALSLMGFIVGEGMIFGLISNNRYDAWGHAGLAAAMLLIGFVIPYGSRGRAVLGQSTIQ
jgi:hypothetical protein